MFNYVINYGQNKHENAMFCTGGSWLKLFYADLQINQ